jgi:hypothetical protein
MRRPTRPLVWLMLVLSASAALAGCQSVDREELQEERRKDTDNFYGQSRDAILNLTPDRAYDWYRNY